MTKIMYANRVCEIVSETAREVKLVSEGEEVRTSTIGGYCGTKKRKIEMNTFAASKKNIKPYQEA